MLNEVVKFLDISASGIYVDSTFGQSGHTSEILRYLNKYGKMYILDKDYSSYNFSKNRCIFDNRVNAVCTSYDNILNFLNYYNLSGKVDGIIADLGLSLCQIKNSYKGFGFCRDGFLDMRLDFEQELRAVDWINNANLSDLEQVFFFLGNSFLAKQISKKIISVRKKSFIRTSRELCNLIFNMSLSSKKVDFNQFFQALRVFVNNELYVLNNFLEYAFVLLKTGGFLIIISFNSVEDALVKSFFFKKRVMCTFLKPSFKELSNNCSSRSAIIRIFKK